MKYIIFTKTSVPRNFDSNILLNVYNIVYYNICFITNCGNNNEAFVSSGHLHNGSNLDNNLWQNNQNFHLGIVITKIFC